MKTILVPPLLVFACLAVLTQDSWSQLPASLTNGLVARYTFSNNASNSFGPGGNAVPAGDFAYLQGGGVRITGDLGEHASLGGGYIELPVASYGISSNFTFNLIMKDVTHTKYWGEVLLYWGIDGPGRKVVFIDAKPTNNWGWGQIGPGYPEYVQFGVTANHWATNIPSVLSSVNSSFFDQKRLITAVKSSSNISLYLDGVLVGEATNGEALPSESVMHIGRHTWTESGGGTTTALSASIFEFSAYNRALSSTEVAALYNAQSPTGDPDNDGVNNYREIADGTDPNDPNSFNPLSKGLVAYYPFDGNANDESGYGNNSEVFRVKYAADRFCKSASAADFRDNAYAEVPGLRTLKNYPITYSAWIYLENYHTQLSWKGWGSMFIIGKDKPGDGNSAVIGLHTDAEVQNRLRYSRGPITDYVPATKKWIHLALSIQSDLQSVFYIDGSIVSSWSADSQLFTDLPFRISTPYIFDQFARQAFQGYLDSVRIYNRALSVPEVKQLYYAEAFNETQRTFLAANPFVQGHFSVAEYNANRTNGRTDVTANPSAYNLFTQQQHDSFGALQFSNGQSSVTTNPSAFNLFTQTQFEANYNSGLLAGRAQVTDAPASFGLLSSNSVPSLRFTAGRAVSFSLSMPGQWTRYTQSEPLPKGWSFNTNTGVLRGRLPLRGMSKAVITPSSPSNSGTPITIEFQPR